MYDINTTTTVFPPIKHSNFINVYGILQRRTSEIYFELKLSNGIYTTFQRFWAKYDP